jgi:hypothetical protein
MTDASGMVRVCSECVERLYWDTREEAYVDHFGSTGCVDRVKPENGHWPHEVIEFDTAADADNYVRSVWVQRDARGELERPDGAS